MKRINEITVQIQEEIGCLVRLDAVATFVDARYSPFRIFFCDRYQSRITVEEDLSRLQALFAEFRLLCNEDDVPPWLCAVHFVYGRKRSMSLFYEEDYDFGLGSAELMNVVISDFFQHFEQIKSAMQGGDSTKS